MKYSVIKKSRCPHCGRRRRPPHFERRIVERVETRDENLLEVEHAASLEDLIAITARPTKEDMLEVLRAHRAESLEHERAMMIEAAREARLDKLVDKGLAFLQPMPRKPQRNGKDGDRT